MRRRAHQLAYMRPVPGVCPWPIRAGRLARLPAPGLLRRCARFRAGPRWRHRRGSARHPAQACSAGPGLSRYRPSDPTRMAPICSGSAKIAAAPIWRACGVNPGQPRTASLSSRSETSTGELEVTASRHGPSPRGHLQLGQLLTNLTGHAHDVSHQCAERRSTPSSPDGQARPPPHRRQSRASFRRMHCPGRHHAPLASRSPPGERAGSA